MTNLSAHIDIAPQFYDIDLMNVVWHGHYVRYLEDARSALLDKIGHNYNEMVASGFAWPLVDMRLKYVKPLKLHQKIRVTATVIEFENRLKIEYQLIDRDTGNILTKAYTIQVAVDIKTQDMLFETPPVFQEAVQNSLKKALS